MSSGKNPLSHTTCAVVEKIELDNRISLRYYYRIADNLLQEANIHRQMKNIVDLYTALLKFASLISETIPIHRDYIASNQAEKSYYKKKLLLALEEMESLKPQVQKRVNEIRNGHTPNSQQRVEKQDTSRSDRPNPTTSLHLEIKQNWGTSGIPTSPRGSRTEQKHQERGSSSSTTRYMHSQNYIPARYETPVATAFPSAPPIESVIIDNSPIPSHLIDSDAVDATSSMVENLSVKAVEDKGNTTASASCAICLDAPIEGACVPCGHMAGCMSCLNEIKAKRMSCPVCRAKVELVLRLYAV
ncbi:AMSH-like ubiquitin thioesterase 3 [Olea europaea subsp. europaea]|uniref:AMSH-like ubiquitin thioesterase 3 n=2 Tax=Olea europaea subsp. europaea TaxID=158383 RepID=A0A8S0UTK4_OLEEU|nr:AMSH-like ubiquitin thioesterase 3 [Olea europaea subsp. europaea]